MLACLDCAQGKLGLKVRWNREGDCIDLCEKGVEVGARVGCSVVRGQGLLLSSRMA